MNPSENSTTVLRKEHQVILKVLDALDCFLDAGTQHGNWHWDALEECVTFFRLYADACHHGKEEDLLFPELVAKGMPREARFPSCVPSISKAGSMSRRCVSPFPCSHHGTRKPRAGLKPRSPVFDPESRNRSERSEAAWWPLLSG